MSTSNLIGFIVTGVIFILIYLGIRKQTFNEAVEEIKKLIQQNG